MPRWLIPTSLISIEVGRTYQPAIEPGVAGFLWLVRPARAHSCGWKFHRNTGVRGRSYAPAGKTPVTYAVGGTRQKLLMIATVTKQGKTRWMIIDEAFNSDKLIEFPQALVKDAGRKVLLILDNLRVHHSKPDKAWAAERKNKIELFYLPSYSPELNPEERLNVDLRHAIGS